MLEVSDKLKNQIKKENIGKNKDFSYEENINPIPSVVATDEVYEYNSDGESDENGWIKTKSNESTKNFTNTKTTFHLDVTVRKKDKNAQMKVSKAKADYVYEFQWKKNLQLTEEQQLESWRYVYYDAPLTNGEKYISADTWVRKMDRIYRYQELPLDFPFYDYDCEKVSLFGRSNNFLVDYKDNQVLDFINTKPISNKIGFDGSFFLNEGVFLRGKNNAQLSTDNLLYLGSNSDPSNGKNLIKDLNVIANTGIYIDIPVKSSDAGLYIDSENNEIRTPNLFINHTGKNGKDNGFFLSKGIIVLDKNSSTSNFSEYVGNSKKSNQQDKFWTDFMKGGLVIAGSQVHLGPLKETIKINGIAVNSKNDDTRKLQVKNGNFMLTSAAMNNTNEGEADFAYSDQEGTSSKPRQPTLLELSGINTSLIIENGVSFIDAPKMKRRVDGQKDGIYYNDKKYWNTIRLTDKSQLDLGTVGIELFNLETDKDTSVTMKLLPDLKLFDTTFIKNGFRKQTQTINGKLILKTSTQEDVLKLKTMIEAMKNIPVTTKLDEKDATNGEVTIISPKVPMNPTANWVTQRVFDYSELK